MPEATPDTFDISLVIPAWNEAGYLPRLLDTVDAARARYRHGADRIEVIVADNSSTDGTAAIATSRGCRVANVTKRAIAASRNGGAAIARARILAFADADLQIHPDTFNYIDTLMQTRGIAAGASGLVMERWSAGIRLSYWLCFAILLPLGLDGGVVFCRREDFLTVGGYDESRRFAEDVHFIQKIRALGRRRRPRERYATRLTARKLGLNAPIAINSCRKFDREGDWHLFGVAAKAFFSSKVVQRYWYEGR